MGELLAVCSDLRSPLLRGMPGLLATADGRVHLGPAAATGAVQTWKTGTGLIRSVGGVPGAGSRTVDPSVEDAYLLLRAAPVGGHEVPS